MYNISFLNNVTNPLEFSRGANNLTGGILVPGILLVIFIIINIYASQRAKDFSAVFTVSSFILTILSVLAYALEFMVDWMLIYPIIFTIIGVFILIFKNR